MTSFIRFFRGEPRGFLHTRIPVPVPSFGKILACLSILGLVCLSYLFGAAAMHFQLPSSDFLYQAFTGAKAWHERGKSVISSGTPDGKMRDGVTVDEPGKTYDGYTLFTTTQGARARLLDMRGKVVHEWELSFRKAWPQAPHVPDPLDDEQIHWFRCHLFPNGDLLAVYHADGDTPYGYGLVKLDKDSKLLWAYAGHAHHDLDVDEDGTIYTLGQKLASTAPDGLEDLRAPYIADSLAVLSPEGRELQNVPIAECFRDSAYRNLFSASLAEREAPVDRGDLNPSPVYGGPLEAKGDHVHVNSVKVLRQAHARKFPLFRAGQVLISLRNLHIIAVLDLHERTVVWASRGMWRFQHDPEFLDNGHLLLFDNLGSTRSCRVVEYDPVTQAVPWVYAGENSTPFHALFRGMKQRLPKGNTLVVDPDNGRILEVTAGKELVWECFGQRPITCAQRYGSEALTFLKDKARARP
jgi:hypothetical protein